MEPRTYTFKFMVVTVNVTVDHEKIVVKQGLSTRSAYLENLRYLYVIDHENVGYELVLSHEPKHGSKKRLRLNASLGEAEFRELIEALIAYKPDIDIRELPLNEAHKLMGATNFVKMAPFIGVAAVTGVVAIMTFPMLLHGLDDGHVEVDIADVAADGFDPQSRNVLVKNGRLLNDKQVVVTTTEGSRTVSRTTLVPVVASTWRDGQPVHLVARVDGFETVTDEAALEGILRNIWFEGIGRDEKTYFRDTMNVDIADEVIELEYRADNTQDLVVALGTTGGTFVLMVMVSVFIAWKRARAR